MQDSFQLPDNYEQPSQSQQNTTKNMFNMVTSIISPKNRRLAHSWNTASQQSLAYSNSTYHNKLTQRSPPLFNLEFLSNNNMGDQNVNTLNYGLNLTGKNELTSTFGAYGQNKVKGTAIRFDRITEQSGIQSEGNSFFINNNKSLSGIGNNEASLSKQQLIELPCFLSLQNSPQNVKNNKKCSQEQMSDIREVLQKDSLTIPMKQVNYKKINPSLIRFGRNEEFQNQRSQTTTRRRQLVPQGRLLNKELKKSRQSKKQIKKHKQSSNEQEDSLSQEKGKKQYKESNKHKSKEKRGLSQSPQSQNRKSSSLKKTKQEDRKSNKSNNKSISRVSDNESYLVEGLNERGRIRQLEFELRTCEIERQELRTRVSILNQLLEEKFLENNLIVSKLSINNMQKPPNYKAETNKTQVSITKQSVYQNIDLLVEVKQLKLTNQILQKENEQIKNHLKNLVQKIKAQANFRQVDKSSLELLLKEISQSRLFSKNMQQKGTQANKDFSYGKKVSSISHVQQSSINYQNEFQTQSQLYTENQTYQKQNELSKLKQKLQYYELHQKQTEQTIKMLEEKQKRFQTIERPKMLQKIQSLTKTVNQQKDTIQKLQMENNLITQLQNPQNQHISSPYMKKDKQMSPQPLGTNQLTQKQSLDKHKSPLQNKTDNGQKLEENNSRQLLNLKKQQQLIRLKEQRDYFLSQYKGLKQLQKINYNLRLKIQDLQNQLSSIKQLIQVDDEITF